MSSRNCTRASQLGLFSILLVAAACGGTSPTNPSPSPTATTNQYTAPPATVSSVMPTSLSPATTAQTIIVEGTNFMPGLTAALTASNGETTTISGSAIQSLTTTSFEASVTVSEPGAYTLRVTNPSAPPSSPVTVTAQTTSTAPPTVTGMSPASPSQSSTSQVVLVAGTNFQVGLGVVLFGPTGTMTTLGATAVDGVTQTLFRLSVTLADAGTYRLRVSNPSGQMSEPFCFTATPAAPPARPTVTGLSPASPTQSSTAQMVYVNGTNFESGLSVALTFPNGTTTTLSGSALTYFSSTTFKMMAVTLADAGSYSLRVTNPSGQVSEPFAFTVQAPAPPARPTVTGLSPATPTQNSAPQMVYVNGTNFESGLTVALTLPGGSTTTLSGSALTYFSSTTFKMMAVTLATAGSYSLRVTNPSGQVSEPFAFTVNPPARPTVSGLSPSAPTAGSAAQMVYIVGTNFDTGATVVLTLPNGTTTTLSGPTAVPYVSSTTVKIMVALAQAGSYSLRVVNPSGQASEPFAFTVNVPVAPTVTALSPSAPTQSSSPQMVYVTGTGFESGLTATLTLPGGTTTTLSGSAITYFSATSFKMPSVTLAAAGTHTLRVTNTTSGLTSAPFTFTVNPPPRPTVAGLSPASPTKSATAQNIYIAGTNFESGATVTVTLPDGTTTTLSGSTAVPYVSATTIKIVVTLADAGSYSLRVTNPSGLVSEPYAFTVSGWF